MKLRDRIMALQEKIIAFTIDNGLMMTDEKVTFDYVRKIVPDIDKETARRFAKIIETLNRTRESSYFLGEIKGNELSAVFNSVNDIIMKHINANGAAPIGTPAKLINAALIVEEHNRNATLKPLEQVHGR